MPTLRLFRVNSLALALREEEVLTVVDWAEPTPLPFAPSSVLGIVSVYGRMFTVVDVGVLLESEKAIETPQLIVALRGDEQLAIAVNDTDGECEVDTKKISDHTDSDLILGTIHLERKEVSLLNTETLFAGVIRGRERRHRRF